MMMTTNPPPKDLASKITEGLLRVSPKYKDAVVYWEEGEEFIRITIEHNGYRYRRQIHYSDFVMAKDPESYENHLAELIVEEFCKQ